MGTQKDTNGEEPSLDNDRAAKDRAIRMVKLRALAAEIRANMHPDVTSDHDWLYDEETGLPQ